MMRLARSIVGNTEAAALSRIILEDGYLGMGSEVQAFETELAAYIGVPPEGVTCVNTGTAALHLALSAVLQPGDEVLVQSMTFVATFQAITAAGGVPVACEVYPENVTIDLVDAKHRLTDRTRAIVPVHYASNPGNLDKVYDFAREYNLRVIEDAAHAFGCQYNSKHIGSFGDIICFSFDGIKNITSGEGGAIVTSDPRVRQSVKDSRLLGVEKDTEKRYLNERSWEFDVSHQGWRYHMSNLFAAIGRVQLRRLDTEFAPRRILLAQRYRERLTCIKGVGLFETAPGSTIPFMQPIRVFNGKRDLLQDAMKSVGIPTGIHYKPNHLLSFYGGGKQSLPVTEKLFKEIITLPLHPGLSLNDIDFVCDSIDKHLKETK
jgi:dTDP-4-amino-4,6-dideoxygalactose transaminase